MATDATKVRVAVTGELSVGLTSATAPTSTASAITGFTGLGFVSDDGVTETRDRSTDTIGAWQNSATVRTVVTDGTLTYQCVLLETKKEVVETFYGTTVTQTASDGNFVVIPTGTGGIKSFVLDIVDGAELMRGYIPAGEVTEVGDRVYAGGEAIGYDITITAYPSAAIGGGSAKWWMTALKTP